MPDVSFPAIDGQGALRNFAASDPETGVLTPYRRTATDQQAELVNGLGAIETAIGDIGGANAVATVAAPTYSEGADVNLSVNLAGDLRVISKPNPGSAWPVTGNFYQATQPVSGPLTDTQLRATAVPVSGPITSAQMSALNPATTTLQTALNTLIGAASAGAWASGDSSLMSLLKAIATAANATAPTIVVQEAPSWVYIPASFTDTAGGNANDLLDCLLVIPATTSPGAVSIEDGAGTNYTLFAGGATSVSTLIPFPIDMRNIAAGTGWEITTGANVAVIAFYRPRT